VVAQQSLCRGGEVAGGHRAEHVGEEVEPHIVKVVNETLAALGDQIGDERGGGPEQGRGVEPDPQVVLAQAAGLLLGFGHPSNDRLGHAGVVPVQHAIAGYVGFFGDLQRGRHRAVLGDEFTHEADVAGDVAAPGLILGHQVKAPPGGGVAGGLGRCRGRMGHPRAGVVGERQVGPNQEGAAGAALQEFESRGDQVRVIRRAAG